ncbi:Bifunctional solanapyrone synthase [Lachnellula suecica]|uniref:Bifunctional solanapyrone synthase n=1 Tax=Lachnellula suecica TaxID=602035 RepID=A0A8T9CQC1_9HELO|nr:Bifunctional solanapyrone synthase [Lachnellula suecica]
MQLLPLFLLAATSAAQTPQSPLLSGDVDACHNACAALQTALGDRVFYDSNSPLEGFRDEYYSAFQREVVPACVVTPLSAADVSEAVNVIRDHQCIFATKSGGHTMFPGASNAPGGITLDLKMLNRIEVNVESETAGVGTGNRWKDVYKVLEPLNVTVVGGRDSNVGVGGFVLGGEYFVAWTLGGISFVSRRYGWALDNVRNFEVVLANGSLTNVNQQSSPDLYFALRGGGNNFGIVTRFDLEMHPQGQVWGGQNIWLFDHADMSSRRSALGLTPSRFSWTLNWFLQKASTGVLKVACRLGYCTTIDKMFEVFLDVVRVDQVDPYAQLYMSLGYAAQVNAYIAFSALIYSKPEEHPEVFSKFHAIKNVYSTNRFGNLTDMYDELNGWNEGGFRQEWAAITVQPNKDLLMRFFEVYMQEIELVKEVNGLIPSMVIQPINKDEIRNFGKNGGNCLGFEDDEGPYLQIVVSSAFRWTDAADDQAMHTAGKNFIDRCTALAKEMDLLHPYIYQNYANASQDVFAGYGEKNRKKLKGIQDKYDPEGVFSKLQPGYFKV